ncbi:hypothetical protein [Comamonas aquatica]|uniref:hypothetical protein n=1 Tax=Comamonas aquatica TaxID=225991 RepID=UPI002449FACC|nr:hypothetical protein [Comamonas aquatica]MDH0495741.1 hypothetical protein [Comamonas aquatica]
MTNDCKTCPVSTGTHKPAEAVHQIDEPQAEALLELAAYRFTVENREARIAELEGQLEAIGAGGVEPLRKQAAAPQAVQAAVPLPLLVRDIARDLGITVPQACNALKPLGNYSTNSAVTAEMARMLRDHFPAPAHPAEGVPAQDWQDAVAEAAQARAAGYEGDDRKDIKTDVFNAFAKGADWERRRAALAATQPAAQGMEARDAAFEAVRKTFCKLQRYSFFLDSRGNVRRCADHSGNWVEFEAVHTLFEPQSVDAALAAQAKQGEKP